MGCDKLEKYIYSEDIEDYYYAKKIVLEPYPELQAALERYLEMKRQLHEFETRFIRKTSAVIAKIKKESSECREFKYLLNSKIRAKNNFEKLFELYGTLSTHFLYEKNEELAKQMMPEIEPIAEMEAGPQEQANFEQIVRELQLKEVVAEAAPVVKKEPRKKRAIAPD